VKQIVIACVLAATASTSLKAADLEGPARFCGYSPVIDLLPGERITLLKGGIHGGTFRWDGAFGSLDVFGIGWARKPNARVAKRGLGSTPTRFAERQVKGRYEIVIWNRSHGAAYFTSAAPFTPEQILAIGRVHLIDEGQTAEGCKLTTRFFWETSDENLAPPSP
jgi:hypothetical protein